MSRLIGLGLLLAGLLYPFAVYYGTEHFAPWQFGLLLGSLWLLRAVHRAMTCSRVLRFHSINCAKGSMLRR